MKKKKKYDNSQVMLAVLIALGLLLSFVMGVGYNKFKYYGRCSSMGGTRSFKDDSICVIEKPVVRENKIYFDKQTRQWKDNYGVCHTCTPENGFSVNGELSN